MPESIKQHRQQPKVNNLQAQNNTHPRQEKSDLSASDNATIQSYKSALGDNRPAAIAQRRLAAIMDNGYHAVAQRRQQEHMFGAAVSGNNMAAIQRKITAYKAPPLPTPAESIKAATNISLKDQLLPGTSARRLGTIERPHSITAEVDKKSIRDGERDKAKELSVVTAMARAEQFLLQGVDLQKFYDAGHLIGDQLIGKTTNSFEYYNLAPQVSSFNTPVYAGTEKNIRDTAKKKNKVELTVDLEYPPDYSLKIQDLVRRPVIANKNYSQNVLNTQVNFARRIPHKWNLHAKTLGNLDPAPLQQGNQNVPTLGQPYGVKVQDQVLSSTPPQSMIKVNWMERRLIGIQWHPGTDVSTEDIISLLIKTFPDVGEPNDVAQKLISQDNQIVKKETTRLIKVAAGDVALELLDLAEIISTMKDPTVLAPLSTNLIRDKIKQAQSPDISLAEAAGHLLTAKSWVQDIKQASQEAKEEEPWLFSLSQLDKFNEPFQKQQDEWDFSISQSAPNYKPSNKMEEDEIDNRFSFSNGKDLSARVSNLSQGFGSRYGKFELAGNFGEQGLPVNYHEIIQITNDPPRFVRVLNCQRLTTLNFGDTGNWIITFEDPI